MTRPHLLLIHLVAGRDLQREIDEAVVRTALEHRVAGLLKTAIDQGAHATEEAKEKLMTIDIASWARNRALVEATKRIAGIAEQLAIDIAFIKGITTESRWYSRLGERPAQDVDLVLAPWHRHRAIELVAALQPSHSLLPTLERILRKDRIQSIDLGFNGLPVDLHLDPLKLEVASTRYPERFWEGRCETLLDGSPVPVFDPTVTLLLSAHALNKDRFRYLIGYADVIRIEADPAFDMSRCEQLARSEGLLVPFRETLVAVSHDLGLAASGGQHPIWQRLWGEPVRLRGKEASVRFRYRQSFLPLFDARRWPEVVVAWWRRLFPTTALLNRQYPDIRGPYLLRIVTARISRRLMRRRQREDVTTD